MNKSDDPKLTALSKNNEKNKLQLRIRQKNED